ncbi:MAG TPA: ribonuclease HII [Longimicrobiales bacterium]|nr:ribonuclease HII [Longimicrobiales bacterium]
MSPPIRRHRLRLRDPLRYERDHWERGILHVAGLDEVGRGPLAGPVVAAAVVLPPETYVREARDSKAVAPRARPEVAAAVREAALAWSLGAASAREIDALGIVPATVRALRRALAHLEVEPGHVVLDGRPVRGLGREHHAVVKGDYRVHCVACASILAKVCRDTLMERLDPRYPHYGWGRNKGYGTAEHLGALERVGPSPHHRMSFGGVLPAPVDA